MIPEVEFEIGQAFQMVAKPNTPAIIVAVAAPDGDLEEDWYILVDTSNWVSIPSESLNKDDMKSFLGLLVVSEVIVCGI